MNVVASDNAITDTFARRAQTNIQLYNQLLERGFDDADLLVVRRAYWRAAEIFAGWVCGPRAARSFAILWALPAFWQNSANRCP